ncbi:uncharacterized protein Dwil_GK13510 [Drosophila willistoni]|uniref:Galectin n=1 Tax=Drosophila willistoni TaxID=7260 RepID=B4NIN7_DROWI|nr:uncharacterized protein LOC6650918 isoform X2 [Drosophila willistoni]EDW83751.1 uncharacterized protein Dwil_GK13510 [Drosophila willistoni]
MPNVKYLCVLPTVEKDTDRLTKLTVRGTLTGNPQEFSVNFVNDPTCTDNITYHFKVLVRLQTIIENYKQKGEWSLSHKETYLNIFDETDFYLEFTLDYANSTIVVYQLRDSGHNFICEYNTLFDLTEIQAVQIWGDVQKINLFAMGYD